MTHLLLGLWLLLIALIDERESRIPAPVLLLGLVIWPLGIHPASLLVAVAIAWLSGASEGDQWALVIGGALMPVGVLIGSWALAELASAWSWKRSGYAFRGVPWTPRLFGSWILIQACLILELAVDSGLEIILKR